MSLVATKKEPEVIDKILVIGEIVAMSTLAVLFLLQMLQLLMAAH